MASLTRSYTADKLTGRVYTPPEIVARILDLVGFQGEGIARRRVLDPACGDGQFLAEVVRRILDAVPPADRPAALARVHGWDIDADAVAACCRRLDALAAPLTVDWNVGVRNALGALPDGTTDGERFDLVVGNPPYVRIQHLDAADRRTLQTRFTLTRAGSTDLYIAFFELALALLAPGGRVGYVTPNSYFHTAAGAALRAHLAAGRHVRHVVDYGARQVFPGVTTYAAITVLGDAPVAQLDYVDASGETETTRTVRSLATRGPWRFGADGDALDPERYRPLRELARVRVGLATLADRVFIGSLAEPSAFDDAAAADAVGVRFKDAGDVPIERGLLRRIVKGSKVRMGEPPWRGQVIVFPYARGADGAHALIPEAELAARFPLGHAYLTRVRPRLDRRDNGRPNAAGWYAFGRTQALDTAFSPKILCPPMAKTPTFVVDCDAETTLYSGYFITSDHDLDALAAQLASDRMADWVRAGSRDYAGGWKGYSKASFQDFPIDVTAL